MKGLFIDFEDSFSANIIQYFSNERLRLDYIRWSDVIVDEKKLSPYSFFVLGPGPGSIADYKSLDPFIHWLLAYEKKVIGICLGHQLIGVKYGYEIAPMLKPLHGKKLKVNLSKDFGASAILVTEFYVQFYNSWYLKPGAEEKMIETVIEVDEQLVIAALRNHHLLGYQFHPESVGTSCPELIFRNIKKFLYNSKDELED